MREALEARVAWFDKFIEQCRETVEKREARVTQWKAERPVLKAQADALAAENETLRRGRS